LSLPLNASPCRWADSGSIHNAAPHCPGGGDRDRIVDAVLVHPTLEDRHINQTRHALEAVMAEATAHNPAARASG